MPKAEKYNIVIIFSMLSEEHRMISQSIYLLTRFGSPRRHKSCRKFLKKKTSLRTISRTINVGNNVKFYAHDTFESSLLCKAEYMAVPCQRAATHSVYEILIQRELFDQKSIER
jgi:hypothetical protein